MGGGQAVIAKYLLERLFAVTDIVIDSHVLSWCGHYSFA